MKRRLCILGCLLGLQTFQSYCARQRIFSSRYDFYDTKKPYNKVIKKKITAPVTNACSVKYDSLQTLTPERTGDFFKKLVVDTRDIFSEVATPSTLKVIAGFLPFYLIGRKIDERAHAAFYNGDQHLNINQPPTALMTVFNDAVYALPFVFLGSQGIFSRDPYIRRAGQIFALGTFYTWATKVLIKEIETDAALRPLNENFKPSPRVHGGNPSGHTAIIAFLSTYYGLYKGKKYGVPCALYAGLTGALLVTTNRHYVSQVFAGAALGVIFGLAAHRVRLKLTHEEYSAKLAFGPTSDAKGGVGFGLSYQF